MTYKLVWKDCLAGDSEYFATKEEAIEALKKLDDALFVSLVNEDKYQAERKTELFPEDAMEFMVKFVRALSGVLVENRKLREALENIKEKAVLEESEASNATYGFAYEIEELARESLKGGKEC